jgi:osmotically-inducible protein OsmY
MPQQKRNDMSNKSSNRRTVLNGFGLIICLGTLPILVGVTGCATSSRYTQSETERINDLATSSRVKEALSRDSQRQYCEGVNVETFKDVVQLSGFVNTRDIKNAAVEVARTAAGGREVRNNITVKE